MEAKDPDEVVQRVEIVGDLDLRAAEALYLEIRRLAREHGFTVTQFRIEESADEPGGGSA